MRLSSSFSPSLPQCPPSPRSGRPRTARPPSPPTRRRPARTLRSGPAPAAACRPALRGRGPRRARRARHRRLLLTRLAENPNRAMTARAQGRRPGRRSRPVARCRPGRTLRPKRSTRPTASLIPTRGGWSCGRAPTQPRATGRRARPPSTARSPPTRATPLPTRFLRRRCAISATFRPRAGEAEAALRLVPGPARGAVRSRRRGGRARKRCACPCALAAADRARPRRQPRRRRPAPDFSAWNRPGAARQRSSGQLPAKLPRDLRRVRGQASQQTQQSR